MKYFLIAGEASGDLHASNLMKALLDLDAEAEFCYMGGDLMKELGGTFTYKRGVELRLDIDPAGENLTVAILLDGTSRQTYTYDDASRTIHELTFTPDYDFHRVAIKFSGGSGSQKVYGVRVATREVT